MDTPTYTMSDESLMVIVKGEPFTIKKGDKNFEAARAAIFFREWDKLPQLVARASRLTGWSNGQFTYKGGQVLYGDTPLPRDIQDLIVRYMDESRDYRPLLRFWLRLQKNPSRRAVTDLFRFIQNAGDITIGKDGCILAYKHVGRDFMSHHADSESGKHVRWAVGDKPSMPRNAVADDPREPCAAGLHVGGRSYFSGGGVGGSSGQWMIVKVDPADVVSVPYEMNSSKLRCCAAVVVGQYGATLSEDIWDDEVLSAFDDMDENDFPASTEAILPSPVRDAVGSADDDAADSWEEDLWDDEEGEEEDEEGEEEDEEGEEEDEEDEEEEEDEEDEEEEEDEEDPAPKSTPAAQHIDAGDPSNWAAVDKMKMTELQQLSIGGLRTYASQHLKIVGASKIPGGKDALIARIWQILSQQGN